MQFDFLAPAKDDPSSEPLLNSICGAINRQLHRLEYTGRKGNLLSQFEAALSAPNASGGARLVDQVRAELGVEAMQRLERFVMGRLPMGREFPAMPNAAPFRLNTGKRA